MSRELEPESQTNIIARAVNWTALKFWLALFTLVATAQTISTAIIDARIDRMRLEEVTQYSKEFVGKPEFDAEIKSLRMQDAQFLVYMAEMRDSQEKTRALLEQILKESKH